MADPIITVEPPRRDPRLGGLLTVAEVREEERLAASNRAQFVAEPCNFTFGDTGFCYGDIDPSEDGDKTYTGISANDSVVLNFAAYYGVQCFINDESDLEVRARSAFDLAESRHVESKFAVWLNAQAVTATSIPAEVTTAIAAADQHADNNYIARPVIHLSRANAVLAHAAQSLIADGNGGFVTPHGNPVVTSGKYGQDLWVTGAVTVLRSPLVVSGAQTLTLNTESAIAERVYGILVDCDYVARFDFTA